MKLLILIALFIMGCNEGLSQTGKVIVQVKKVDLIKGGELSVAFFSKDNFPKVGRQSFGATKKVYATTMEIIFEQVPVGQYGIALFQDVDRNRELKTNFLGIPMEPFGFSNNAKLRFGPPSFEDARVVVENGRTLNLIIQLR